MTQEAILNKVRKLLRLADKAGTPEEAASAAAMAQRLIAEHQLSTAMLSLDTDTPAEPDEDIVDFGARPGGALDADYSARWHGTLAVIVAAANGCKPYRTGKTLHLIGRPSDADSVRYMYAFLRRQVDEISDRDGRGMGITWRNNFRTGMVETIGRRLQAAQRQVFDEARAAAVQTDDTRATSTALVRVNTAIARVEQRKASVDTWAKSNMKLRTVSSSGGRYDPSARAMGREAGNRVDLGGGRQALSSGRKALTAG